MAFLFEKLDVYQKAVDFAERAISVSKEFPNGNYFIADQFKRASTSIMLNIAEGYGRWHQADKKKFYIVSRGSAYECAAILDLCKKLNLMPDHTIVNLKNELIIVCKMLTQLIKMVSK